MENKNFVVLTEKFEGPMEALLDLIEKEKLDITQISIAKITNDFLLYMKTNAGIMEPFILATFIAVASRLILIKSRVLLPFLKFTDEEEEQMADLEGRLLEYKKFKEAAKGIKALINNANISFSREQFLGEEPVFFPPANVNAENLKKIMENLIKAFEDLKIEIPEEHIKISVSLQNIIADLRERIIKVREISFSEFKNNKSKKIEVILAFLAILEMIKEQVIFAQQDMLFGDINLIKKEVDVIYE